MHRFLLISTIAVADEQVNRRTSQIVGTPLSFGTELGQPSFDRWSDLLCVGFPRRRDSSDPKNDGNHTSSSHRSDESNKSRGHERLVAAAFHYEIAKDGLKVHTIVL